MCSHFLKCALYANRGNYGLGLDHLHRKNILLPTLMAQFLGHLWSPIKKDLICE